MPLHRSGPSHRALLGAVRTPAVLLSSLALLLVLPGMAEAAVGGDGRHPAHPDKDWMGSTLVANEGHTPAKPASSRKNVAASVEGVDVSSHNGNVAWSTLKNAGVRFAYVKATEGTTYQNPNFTQQYNGSYKSGMIRGSYHFALPANSTGAAQANYFASHGGGWSRDGKTLPGALDVEYNPYGAACYGKSQKAMVDWISDFVRTYKSRTGRDTVIYTSATWWKTCTGNSTKFRNTNPLWVPNWSSSVGTLPGGWPFHTFWQYTSTGKTVGDHDRFNGSFARLQALANG
ncbi:GH25 family lysozyme M1 (1,4-beta-N-acetylmuramidase) [Streptomyces sp. Amel2xB2]|uniref:Lysozyme n=1 Tax=Streptomyces nanshensis TaxID=518642 RepID=A0A1E7L703_9ACTN|nr:MULTISPECIES: lysozyme [Streptomyces]OEV11997.1 lysozyme [Streptomyces nanshensis]RAJ66945.1 GH25 family lysozyme M1 (1,4-beta-N-acetylmuramidase) [Streptomyces sp. Amel2xB2]